MKEKSRIIIAVVSVLAVVIACVAFRNGAFGGTAISGDSYFQAVTREGNSTGRCSMVTVKCFSNSDPIRITLVSNEDCTVRRTSGENFEQDCFVILYPGNSFSFNVDASLGNSGALRFRVNSENNGNYRYSVSGSGLSCIEKLAMQPVAI